MNNSKNNDDRHKTYKIFLVDCFVFVIALVIAQIAANSLENTLQLTVRASVSLTKIRFWPLRCLEDFFLQFTKYRSKTHGKKC